ncbi:hypothetical protein HK099_000531 [Clydaea vesicula]|uniref:Uncharacterized protein n=1 Tax=Clydaea vesicula TaxID=447962 RepID=A0AAD5TUZ6_9FUNG|nr:hypothetical protein HK099_000531 [Clydaea vesicula]
MRDWLPILDKTVKGSYHVVHTGSLPRTYYIKMDSNGSRIDHLVNQAWRSSTKVDEELTIFRD